jgi:hypothetical protein
LFVSYDNFDDESAFTYASSFLRIDALVFTFGWISLRSFLALSFLPRKSARVDKVQFDRSFPTVCGADAE